MDAYDALRTMRAAALLDQAPKGQPVIGVVGPDVPTELIRAAGAVPLRLRGDRSWNLTEADQYLGQGLDAAIRSILAGILNGAFGELHAIVVSSDCDASQRLYYVLRELRRVQPETAIPPVHLVDVLHLPRESTARYNLTRLTEFEDVLFGWTGTRPDADELRQWINAADEVRCLLREVCELRNAVPARLSGTDAHAVIVAQDRMPQDQYLHLLRSIVVGASLLPELSGRRIFLSGSDHDRAGVIAQIEATDATVVGEDHGWGASLVVNTVSAPRNASKEALLDALGRRYQLNAPTSQRGGILDRAAHTSAGAVASSADLVLSYSREMDEAPLWDFAAQRAALAGQGILAAAVTGQKYGELLAPDLELALSSPELTDVVRKATNR